MQNNDNFVCRSDLIRNILDPGLETKVLAFFSFGLAPKSFALLRIFLFLLQVLLSSLDGVALLDC